MSKKTSKTLNTSTLSVSDKELVEQFKNGNKAAFNEIVKRYQKRVYWIIRRLVIEHEDADDITQNVFIRMYNGLNSFRGDSELFTWMYRIATNLSINHLNAEKLKKYLQFGDDETVTGIESKDDANKILEKSEIENLIEKAIQTLPHQQKLVFSMRYYDELSYEEISKILKTSVGGLKANYFHAFKKMQKYLKKYDL